MDKRKTEQRHAVVEEEAPEDGVLPAHSFTTKPASPEITKIAPSEPVLQSSSREAGRSEVAEGNLKEQGTNSGLAGVGVNHNPAPADLQQPEAKPHVTRDSLQQSILSQVRDGVLTHDGKGNGQMSIRLNLEELGELKIQVRMEDNRLKVEVQAENRVVKDLLMSNLHSLKEALSGRNLSMERFSVSTGGGFNSPLREERGNPRQQPEHRFARSGYGGQVEERTNYLTAEVNSLLDVRF